MTPDRADLVAHTLREPEAMRRLTLSEWDLLIRQGRAADLLGRLAVLADRHGVGAAIPPGPAAHLAAARIMVDSQHEEVWREAALVARALSLLDVPVILLKGAGYVVGQVASAAGRLFSDIDILVPRQRLDEVEGTLIADGWATTHHSAYDQKYYRRWMHELPPMRHMVRQTVLDVHHSILPQTSRLRHDAGRMIERAVPVAGLPGIRVLESADMVLHSMTHLFHNEEFARGLRDLSDIDLMLRAFGGKDDFWSRLLDNAEEQDLGHVLQHGLIHAERVFATPVPRELAPGVAGPWLAGVGSRFTDTLFANVLRSPHSSTAGGLAGAAGGLLYLRAHWLRMPPFMLARHLTIKAWMRWRGEEVV